MLWCLLDVTGRSLMNDVLDITRPGVARGRIVLGRSRALRRAQQGSHPRGAGLAQPHPHLAERAYAAELMHAERAGSAVRPGLEPARDRAQAPPRAPAGFCPQASA